MKFLMLDYETFSAAELTDVGAYEYAVHPSTSILCAGIKLGTSDTLRKAKPQLVLPGAPGAEHAVLRAALADPHTFIVAHNALFDYLITTFVLKIETDISRWICTAVMASSAGLPRSLDEASKAFGTKARKDVVGGSVMKRLAKQESDNIDDYMRLYSYCLDDIETMTELFLDLPPLFPMERKFWQVDQRMNLRGFAVDRQFVIAALQHTTYEVERLDNTIVDITDWRFKSARQIGEVKKFLKDQGVVLPNMQAETIAEALQDETLPPLARQVLEVRDAVRRSSTSKYAAFERRSRSDGRARDNTLFYGAHTGRESGTGLQPQNLFRRVLPQIEVENGMKLMLMEGSVGKVQHVFPKPMELFASALRSCIVAGPGKTLLVGDYSTIEVCVLFWLAGHKDGCAALREGRPLYLEMAARIYKVDLQELIAAYESECEFAAKKRQLGKVTVLGCGFGIGLGGDRFIVAAKNFGVKVDLAQAKIAVRTYREMHAPVVRFWDHIEAAALAAMQNPGRAVAMRGIKLVWKFENRWLTCRLPSGRSLYYFDARLQRKDRFNSVVITYMHTDAVTHQYVRTSTWGGKLTENVVQAIARDLLYEAKLRIEKTDGLDTVLAVHDEIVAETPDDAMESELLLYKFKDLMSATPDWAEGMPIGVEAWKDNRYRK